MYVVETNKQPVDHEEFTRLAACKIKFHYVRTRYIDIYRGACVQKVYPGTRIRYSGVTFAGESERGSGEQHINATACIIEREKTI